MAVISKKPKSSLPPILGGTPNPLANVNPNPAGNRNSAFPKTGAVLPFPNPNQPQADLVKDLFSDVPSDVTAEDVRPGSLPPRLSAPEGGTAPPKTYSYGEGASTEADKKALQEELANLQKQFTLLSRAGEDDPNYRPSAGTVAQLRSLESQITASFSRLSALPGSLPPEKPKEPKSIADWIANLPPWLRAGLDVATLGVAGVIGQFGEIDVDKLTDAQIAEGLTALTGHESDPKVAQERQKLQAEKDRRETAAATAAAEDVLSALAKKLGAKDVNTLSNLTPEWVISQFNAGATALYPLTKEEYTLLRDNWQRTHPGQEWPSSLPGTPASQVDQLGGMFAGKQPPTKKDVVAPPDLTDYLTGLKVYSMLPTTAEGAYIWLQRPLEPPPGLVETKEGWANVDGSPPTPAQMAALNKYVGQLQTQDMDRKAAYDLIAAKDGTLAAEKARQKTFENDMALQAQADKAAQERAVTADERAIAAGIAAEKRLEDRTISAEQRAEATRIAAEGRAAAARIEEEKRGETRDIAAENRAIAAGIAAEKRLEDRTISGEQRAEATRIAGEGRAIAAGIAAEKRLEDATIRQEERTKLTKIAQEGRDAAQRIKERASGGPAASADVTTGYREGLKRFSKVPTTLAEATAWLGQPLVAPPGLRFDEPTSQWVDESGNLPTGDRALAVQEYEFQQSQYAQNRKKADGIIQSYADLDDAQRKSEAAEAALQRAFGTKDVLEQVELAYLKDKSDLEFKQAQTKHQKMLVFVELTNNPAITTRLKALGLLNQFNIDTGLNIVVPDRMDRNKVFGMIPSLGNWAKMSPQQQMDALEMLSAKTGWMPEELAALMSEVVSAPGGGGSRGVSTSVVRRD